MWQTITRTSSASLLTRRVGERSGRPGHQPAARERAPADEHQPQHHEGAQTGPDTEQSPAERQRQPDQRQEADERADQRRAAHEGGVARTEPVSYTHLTL